MSSWDSWNRPKTRWPRLVRPTGPLFVLGEKCRFCWRGILWVRREDKHMIAIEPESWKGEDWYHSGKHVAHVRRCVGMREAFTRWKEKYKDLIV